jgi:sulfite reductase alpha subunit-like flavoprotein
LIRENSFRLKAFFQDNFDTFRVFVAGNSKNMPQSVEKALKEVLKALVDDKEEEASALYQKLSKEGRIQFETWN